MDAFESFTKRLLRSVAQIVLRLAGQAIANAVVAGTQSAVATGPGAAFALPGLIGGAVAATRSALPAFAHGGVVPGGSYSGDNILARLNSGEMVLNRAQQANLFRQLNAPHNSNNTAGQMEITGVIEASGDRLQVVLDRATRRRNRIS